MNSGNVATPESSLAGSTSSSLMDDIAYAIDLSFSALANQNATAGQTDTREALSIYCQALEDIAAAAAASNATGLHNICKLLAGQVEDFRHLERSLTQSELAFLGEWPLYLVTYLADPKEPAACEALVRHLQAPLWPSPLPTDIGDSLIQQLLQTYHVDPLLPSTPDSEAADSFASEGNQHPAEEHFSNKEVLVDEPFTAQEQIVSKELLALLMSELGEVAQDMDSLLEAALSPDHSASQRNESLQHYAEQFEGLGMAAEAVGLPMLKIFLTTVQRRILSNSSEGLTPRQHDALALLPGAILAYLAAPSDPSTGEGLVDLLRGETWLPPPDPAYLSALSRALSMVVIAADTTAEPRQTKAEPEDVLLKIPTDLSRELLDGLLQELPLHTAEFSAAIGRIASGQGSLADIDVAKRAAHTLKGAANTVGIKGIANLTHHVEDILVALSKHETLPTRPLADMLTNAGDCLEAMGEAVMGTGPEPEDALAILQEVLDWANRVDQEGIPQNSEPDASSLSGGEATPRTEQGDSTAPSSQPSPQSEAMVRIPASLIDELLRLMGETIISTGQVRERSRRLVERNRSVQQQNRVFLQLAMELEDLVELRGSVGDLGLVHNNEEFDPLEFEHYSELHTISRRLIEAATDSGELTNEVAGELTDLNELIEVQNRLHAQSQNTVMRTRMVPVASVISRLQRSVRQTARLLDKNAVLNVSGADTMIDSNILNELIDPLMHILRNAIDHGIESPEKRRLAGKSDQGSIELAFLREGNQVVVRCRDDGAGLDLPTIRRKAEEKGLLTAGQNPSNEELARLILAPGFSTRNESTQVSGRGIGMDVVHSRVMQLKGGVHLHSTPGQGLEIELRLPATLLSTHALIIRSMDQKFAISSYGIQDIHYVTPDQLQIIGEERFFRSGENLYPLVHIDSLLHLAGNRRGNERQEGFPVLLVRLDTGYLQAVQVQEIIDSRELVVKGLGRYVPKTQGIVGATILGDGSVAAVIDVPELTRKPVRLPSGADSAEGFTKRSDSLAAHHHLTALVVDDSLSARRATAQFMKDTGFEVRTAIDGLEAVSILDKWKPDILLVDMEMPRMNGLELTAHIRARPATAHIPVIMITSRSTEKHRNQATAAGVNIYLTKPFGEEELLRHVTELTTA